MTFIDKSQSKQIRPCRSSFNQDLSKDNQEITTLGHMPIIQAPAHDLDTLNIVVRLCMYITAQFGQPNILF